MLDRNSFFAAASNRQNRAFSRTLLGGEPAREGASQTGQALVEFALLVPLLFLLVLITVDFGGFIYSWIGVANASRAGANYGILGSVNAGFPATPTATQLLNVITTDLASLPGTSSSNPKVYVCWNNNGTITTIAKQGPTGTDCTTISPAPLADPEAPTFFTVTVDVTYTYSPFFSAFNFPRLGIHLPSIPTTIHRQVVMRYM